MAFIYQIKIWNQFKLLSTNEHNEQTYPKEIIILQY